MSRVGLLLVLMLWPASAAVAQTVAEAPSAAAAAAGQIYPAPVSYAAAVSAAVDRLAAAQAEVLELQRQAESRRLELLDRQAALLERQEALADRQAALADRQAAAAEGGPTLGEFWRNDAAYAERFAPGPDDFTPGLDERGFSPGVDGEAFSPGPADTESDFFTTYDPPDPP